MKVIRIFNAQPVKLPHFNSLLTRTVNDLINAHSQINAPYLIDAPLEVYSLY